MPYQRQWESKYDKLDFVGFVEVMSFRKRNVAINRTPNDSGTQGETTSSTAQRGVRPSPLTSQPVTSTGTTSLDSLLGGHSGLALGSSLFVEESGTTDFAGALLRYHAAEGICQGHVVHVVGMGEGWARELPGVAEEKGSSRKTAVDSEKMKIAWRYEKMGQAGERGACVCVCRSPMHHHQDMTVIIALIVPDSQADTESSSSKSIYILTSG